MRRISNMRKLLGMTNGPICVKIFTFAVNDRSSIYYMNNVHLYIIIKQDHHFYFFIKPLNY